MLLGRFSAPSGPHRYLEEAHDLQQHRTAFVADRAAFEPPAGLRVGGVGGLNLSSGFDAADDTGLSLGHGAAEFGSSLSSSQIGGGFGLGLSSAGGGGGGGGIAPSSLGGIAGPYRAGGSLIGGGASNNRL